MCVCLSVTTLAATSLVSTLKMRYVGVYLGLFLLFNSWIFGKTFRSKVMANMQISMCSSGLVLVRVEYHACISRAEN